VVWAAPPDEQGVGRGVTRLAKWRGGRRGARHRSRRRGVASLRGGESRAVRDVGDGADVTPLAARSARGGPWRTHEGGPDRSLCSRQGLVAMVNGRWQGIVHGQASGGVPLVRGALLTATFRLPA
jgi:hypothetical protein